MGSLCICVKEPALDNQMILTTASQSQYRNYTSPHIDDKPISQRYSTYNTFTISKSLTTQVFPFKKNFLENPIDEYPETARTKVSSVRNSNTYFKEDFSFTSNNRSFSRDNQRLILPIVDQNSKITTKIRVRNKEIFISNDIVSHLNEDDVIYDGLLLIGDSKKVYVKCTKNFITIYNVKDNEIKEATDVIQYKEIKALNKIYVKDKKGNTQNIIFDIIVSHKEYKFTDEKDKIGKYIYKVICFMTKLDTL